MNNNTNNFATNPWGNLKSTDLDIVLEAYHKFLNTGAVLSSKLYKPLLADWAYRNEIAADIYEAHDGSAQSRHLLDEIDAQLKTHPARRLLCYTGSPVGPFQRQSYQTLDMPF